MPTLFAAARRVLFGSTLALTPVLASAQQADSLLKAQLLNGMFPPAEARALIRVVTDAEAGNVPTGLIEQTIRDGAYRGTDAAEVLSSARADLAILEVARRELGPRANDASVETAANLLRRGMSRATVQALRGAPSSRMAFLPLDIAWYAVRSGVPVDSVSADFVSLVRRRADDTQFVSISLAVAQARYDGTPVLSAYRSQVRAALGAR